MTLTELRGLCERTTKGWHRGHGHLDNWIYDEQDDWVAQVGGGEHDAAFIIAARTVLPALVGVAGALKDLADPLKVAQRFHTTYEWLAPSFGYKTRVESAKSWDEVPEQNRALMEAVCREITTYARAALARLDEVGG